jgi:hypothetical protein
MKRMPIVGTVVVTMLAAVAAAGAVAGAPPGAYGVGVPLFKCDPSGPVAPPTNHPVAVSPPDPYWPSPALLACGSTFFTPEVVSRLTNRFGSLRCFRFATDDLWTLVGDGMQVDGDGPAAGGAVVAVAPCPGSRAARARCLDAESPHDFATFAVVRPPDPAAWPVRLQSTFGDRLLYVADGVCGLVTLDLRTLRWLRKDMSTIDSAMNGGSPPAIEAPPVEPGSKALTGPRRSAIAACPS